MKILLIDDSKAVGSFVRSIFKDSEFDLVKHCLSGQDGLDFLKDHSDEIEFILLDWEMPIMSGIQTLKQIRPLYPDKTIYMCTTRNEVADIELAIQSGADDYIMKPFTLEVLQGKLEDF